MLFNNQIHDSYPSERMCHAIKNNFSKIFNEQIFSVSFFFIVLDRFSEDLSTDKLDQLAVLNKLNIQKFYETKTFNDEKCIELILADKIK